MNQENKANECVHTRKHIQCRTSGTEMGTMAQKQKRRNCSTSNWGILLSSCLVQTKNPVSSKNSLVWVLAKDVLDDDNGLLHHIVDLGLDEVQKCADTAFGWLLRAEGDGNKLQKLEREVRPTPNTNICYVFLFFFFLAFTFAIHVLDYTTHD